MEDSLENKLSMYGAVIHLLEDNTTKTSTITAIAPALLNFKTLAGEIEAKDTEQDEAATGKTANKRQAKTALINACVRFAANIKALGRNTGNNVLIESGDKKRTFFVTQRDTDLKSQANILLTAANDNAAALIGYGISAGDITDFGDLITAYEPTLGARESSRGVQVAAGKEVVTLFKQADVVLKDVLDGLMENFATSDTQFYNEYKSAREIIDLGGGGGGGKTPPEGPNP